MTFNRLFSILFIIGAVLFCTVRIHAQTAGGTSQVSPVANLSGSNSSVVNNNFQYLQNGVNGVLYTIQQYFPGGILQGVNGGTGFNSANVASNDTLVSSNGAWTVVPSNHSSLFKTSGTFTAPAGVSFVILTMQGAGGNGGQGFSNSGDNKAGSGGGGGAGGYLKDYYYPVTAGNSYTVTIGTSGNATVFDAISIASGSVGSPGSGPTSGGAGGVGFPVSVTPDIPAGVTGANGNGTTGSGGTGGGTAYAAGGAGGASANATGNPGSSPASNTGAGGGGGGGAYNGTGGAGGTGSTGFVMVQY